MKNINLIYEHVNSSTVNIHKKPIIIKITSEVFNSDSLVCLAGKVKYLYTYKYMNLDIIFDLENIKIFGDKVTYLLLDALLYDILKHTNFSIRVIYSIDAQTIQHIGFCGTALFRASNRNSAILNRKDFIKAYENPYYADSIVYRRFITRENMQKNNLWASKICAEVAAILKSCSKDEEWIDGISEVVSELFDNVNSHTDGDCLIDIDISNSVKSTNDNIDKEFQSVDIAVINFSENRLFDRIKTYLKEHRYESDDILYKKIYKAYETHKNYFDETYNEDDFFLVTAFQNHVTSREFKQSRYGTGLPTLIEKIIGKTEDDYTYVLSGNNMLFFKTNFLKLSKDRYIGFNDENDYFNFRPSNYVVNRSNLYVPGSIYHLLLIKEISEYEN